MSFPVSNQAGISIHAPTRGATDIPCHTSSVGEFQSTLPRGERPGYAALHTVHLTDFNPRSHEGSDGNLYNGVLRIIDFNPRSHEGSDDSKGRWSRWQKIFQSTLPRGERLHCSAIAFAIPDFNPRSHEGSDLFLYSKRSLRIYFNPRSHEGSDTSLQVHCTPLTPFQSTLPRGERRCRIACMRSIRNFNPRSHEGSDVRSIDSEPELYYFNPRSHEGSDSNFRQKVLFSLSKNCLKYLILTTNYFN